MGGGLCIGGSPCRGEYPGALQILVNVLPRRTSTPSRGSAFTLETQTVLDRTRLVSLTGPQQAVLVRPGCVYT